MAKHEFGIIDSFEENKWYSDYEPEKYNCISVNDNLVEQLTIKYNEELMAIKTYFQVYNTNKLHSIKINFAL